MTNPIQKEHVLNIMLSTPKPFFIDNVFTASPPSIVPGVRLAPAGTTGARSAG